MPDAPINPFTRAGQVRLSEIDRLADSAEKSSRVTVAGGMGKTETAAGFNLIDLRIAKIFIQLTGGGPGGKYSWTRAVATSATVFTPLGDGPSGTFDGVAAVELDLNANIPVDGSIFVEATVDPVNNVLRFAYCCGSGSDACCDGFLGYVCTCAPGTGGCSCGAGGKPPPVTLTDDCCYFLGSPGLGGGTGGGGGPNCCQSVLAKVCVSNGVQSIEWKIIEFCGTGTTVSSWRVVQSGTGPPPLDIGTSGFFVDGTGTTWWYSAGPANPHVSCGINYAGHPLFPAIAALFSPCPGSGGGIVGGGGIAGGGGSGGCPPGTHYWPPYGCVACPKGTYWDGSACVPIQVYPGSDYTGPGAYRGPSLSDSPLGDWGLGGVSPAAVVYPSQIANDTAGILQVATAGGAGSVIAIPGDATKVLLGDGTFGPPPAAGGGWVRVPKTFTDFLAASSSNTLALRAFSAKEVLHAVVIKTSTVFSGGAITSYTLDVGDLAGTMPGHVTGYNGRTAVSTANFARGVDTGTTQTYWTEPVFAAFNLSIRATCNLGTNLNVATAGAVDVWLLVTTLP